MRRFRTKDIAVALGFLLLVMWSAVQFGQARELARWERASERGVESMLTVDKLARSPEVYRDYARTLTTKLFPPDHDLAIDYYRRAILVDPLASVTWFEMASELALIGDDSRSKASLVRSDELDPHYPRQRLGAIQLWANLGDSQRSVALAARLSELGGRYRTDAVRRLLALDLTPSEIYDRIRFEQLEPAERVEVVEALHVDDHQEMKLLFDRLEIEDYDRPEWQAALIKEASSPMVYGAAVRLWLEQEPELQIAGSIVPTDNLDLMRSPFERITLFGWQNLSRRTDLHTRWRAPSSRDVFPHGFIQIEFPHAASQRSLDETIYRTPVPSSVELKLVVRIRLIPATQPTCLLRLKMDEVEVDRAVISAAEEGWQRIELGTRTLEQPRLVELVVSRGSKSQRSPYSYTSEIHVGRLEIEARRTDLFSKAVQL